MLICTLIAANVCLTLAVFMKHNAGPGCDFFGFLANFLWLAAHVCLETVNYIFVCVYPFV